MTNFIKYKKKIYKIYKIYKKNENWENKNDLTSKMNDSPS